MKRKRIHSIAMVAALALALCLPACKTTNGIVVLDPQGKSRRVSPEEVAEMSGEDDVYLLQVGDQVSLSFRVREYRDGDVPWDYRIEVGDSMEVRLMAEMGDRPEYKIDVGDLVGISFLKNWPFNATLTVRPDGMIALAELGDLKAAGLTSQELENLLEAKYAETGLMKLDEDTGRVQITVNVDFSNPDRLENMSRDVAVRPDGAIRIPGLKDGVLVAGRTVAEASELIRVEAAKVLRNPPDVGLVVFPFINTTLTGMNGTATVRPDGSVSVARLGDVQAAGYSADELRQTIDELCLQIIFNDVETSLDVVTITGSRIYVGGEVGIPGPYPLAGSPTALQAVMMARGKTDDARMNNVLVMRRNATGKPFIFKTNLHVAMTKGMTDNDIALRPFDVVYVPKKLVSRADLFVEQYIDDIVPFQNTLGVTGTYYMNTQKTNAKSSVRSLNSGVNFTPPVPNPLGALFPGLTTP